MNGTALKSICRARWARSCAVALVIATALLVRLLVVHQAPNDELTALSSAAEQSQLSAGRFRPMQVVPAQPPMTDAPVVSADEIGSRVKGRELVLGVVVNGKARAYPINMLTGPRREIINDTLGGRPIAATW